MNAVVSGAPVRASVLALLCSVGAALWAPSADADGSRPVRLSRADLVYLRHEAAMFGTGVNAPVAQLAPRASRPPLATTDTARASNSEAHVVDNASRRDAALHGLERSGTVRRCWTAYLLRNPNASARRLPVALHVDADGHVTAIDVHDGNAPELAACIARASSMVLPVGPGEAIVAETTLSLDRGE